MSRLATALFLGTLAAAAGCGPKTFDSICDGSATQPAGCQAACDPSPGAPDSCGSGLHCTEDGKCDAVCTIGGSECGSDATCTSDGRCEPNQSDDDSTMLPDADCPNVMFTAQPVTPSIGLVLDRSGSMYDSALPPYNTRYEAMREALVGTTGVVTELEDKAYFGSLLYTGDDTGPCPEANAVPRALNNAAAIRTSVDAFLNQRGGNTPTPLAIDAMVASFQATPPPAGSPPVIVLATDGLPNVCNNNGADTRPQSVASAAAAYAAGIPVYVLAINQNDQHFQDLANAGQGSTNAMYYPATSAAALKAAFQQIINGVVSCELTIDSPVDEGQAMSGIVTLNGMTLQYGTDWELASPTSIRLLGGACDTLKNSAAPNVTAEFPCGAIVGKTVH